MVHHHVCCVLTCNNTGRNSQCKFYEFPKANWKRDLRNKWIKAVNRKNNDGSPWLPKPFDKICSDHFVGGKKTDEQASPSYIPSIFNSQHTVATVIPGLYNTRRLLKEGIVPSVFHWAKTQGVKSKKRRVRVEAQDPLAVPEPGNPETPEHVVPTFSQVPPEVPIEPFFPEDDDYRCKDCAADTDRFSWWCVQCARGALCGACALRPPHDAHYMLRAPQGATHSQTQTVVVLIRQQLQNENLLTPNVVNKFRVKLELKLESEDPPSMLPEPAMDPKLEPVLDPMLETALDTGPDPVLDLTLEPVVDLTLDPDLEPALEPDPLDPLTTESNEAGKEVAGTKEDVELEQYLAKRKRYMENNKPFHKKKINHYVSSHRYVSTQSQSLQTPTNLRESQTVQTPGNFKGSQTLQTPSNLKQYPRSRIKGSQTPSKLRSSQTVLKVTPSDLIGSQTATASPSVTQTVSKPNNLKIKRTLLKVPISELAKSITLDPSESVSKAIRKIKSSELLKLKKVQNVLKSSTVLTQQNCSKGKKLHNVLKGFSTPLKVTSEPPRYSDH